MRNPDVWVPLKMQPTIRYAFNASSSDDADQQKPWPPQPEIAWLRMFVRVPQADDVPAVGSALTLVHQRDVGSRLDPADAEGRRLLDAERMALAPAGRGVSPLRDELSSPLLVLLAMVGVLLAITCGNVASLLAARATAREREIAIRVAIGAGRWRVVRQLLIETLLLSIVGGGLGLLIAAWGRDALLMMFAQGASVVDLDPAFDPRVLVFALAVTVLAGIAAGLVPALRATRVTPTDALKTEARQVGAGGGRRGARLGKVLVTAQIAFCLLLLVVAGLFVRSMQSLLLTDVGYDRDRLLVARMDVLSMGFGTEQRQALYERVIGRIERIPGVVSASLSLNGPMGTSHRASSLAVEGHTEAPGEQLRTDEETVTEKYFDTVGLEVVQGRAFTAEDRHPGNRNTLINETMARRFFPRGDALGKRWTSGDPIGPGANVIVGVIRDARYREVRGEMTNMSYTLSAAVPDETLGNVEIRTAVPPGTLVTAVRQAVAEVEPALPVYDVVPLNERMNRDLSNDRLIASLTSTFGAIALVLACLGLYGTISYGVSRRVTELGVRMALGANRAAVLWLVVREALTLVAVGACVGVPLAYAAGRSIKSLLYGVGPVDPATYAASAGLLLVIAGVAAYLPAHRASRIDPMAALRRG
jgi:predicted permease